MRIVIFEDEAVTSLFPITLSRPAFDIWCGATSLLKQLRRMQLPIQVVIRPYLRAHVQNCHPRIAELQREDDDTLLVNARVVPSREAMQQLSRIAESGRPTALWSRGALAAAWVHRQSTMSEASGLLKDALAGSPNSNSRAKSEEGKLPLFVYPHDLLRYHLQCFGDCLQTRIDRRDYDEINENVFVADDVDIHKSVDLDTRSGPIVVASKAKVGAFTCLQGPLYVGQNAKIKEHSSIRANTAIGEGCKVGGEVHASVLCQQSNKQHFGYLGHAYLGSWVNLGAGTSNSNLKNSYGSIRVQTPAGKVDTGMQFLGCTIGDFTKTAIHTAIFTGKTIGACSTLYGYVTSDVPSFANYARSFGQLTLQPPEVVAETQRRVFQRRGIVQQSWQVQLLMDMYQQASANLELADKPLAL